MKIGVWTKVQITKCSDPDYWHKHNVGQVVIVKKHTESSWGVEERKTGFQIAQHDFKELK